MPRARTRLDARAAGLTPSVVNRHSAIPERCWATLREAMLLASAD